MATYEEIFDITEQPDYTLLLKKVQVAVLVKAHEVSINPSANKLVWARDALKNPAGSTSIVMGFLLAQYKDQGITTILAATDAQVQAAVDNAVDTLLGV